MIYTDESGVSLSLTLSKQTNKVLIIGDSISEPGSGYGPGVENILFNPELQNTGPLAYVQHNGASGSNQVRRELRVI